MAPDQIGNFKLISALGQGGMGEVWLGEHEKIGTQVAIKMLLPHISANKDHVERFFNEAIAAGKITHSGIVKIFDVGFHNGRAYLVMELLKGESLAARIRRLGRLPLAMVSEIGRQIAGVLDAVHKAGITHRDLKPDNIYLIPDDELASGERVKVLDFGIAKLSGAGGGLTATSAGSMGTPAYMSPEQWKNSKNVDWRADAYSLGCLAFEMVAGQPPFLAETIGEACSKHLTEEPPSLGSLVAVPPMLDQLVAQLLSKSPELRPASMREIATRFSGLVAANPAAVAQTIGTGHILAASSGHVPAASGNLPAASNAMAAASASMPRAAGARAAAAVPPTPTPPMIKPSTTLGGAAASAETRPAKRVGLMFALVGIGGALLVIIIVLVIAVAGGDSSNSDNGAPASAAGSSTEPPKTAEQRTPAPVEVTPIDKPIEEPADKPAPTTTPPPPKREQAPVVAASPPAKPKPAPATIAKDAPAETDAGCDEVSCVLANYPGACCAKYREGPVPKNPVDKPKAEVPETLDRAMISAGVGPVKARVMACGAKSPAKGTVKVSVKVNPDGSVLSVAIKEAPDEALGRCVTDVMLKAHFAKTQRGGGFGFPFVF